MTVGRVKQIAFSEGTSVTAPTEVFTNAQGLAVYANDAAFVTAKGAVAATGDAYYSSSLLAFRSYNGSGWHTSADLDSTQTLSGKTLTAPVVGDYELFTESASPSTPASGKVAVYAKSDKKLYTKDSAGTEAQVGSGGGSKNYVQLPSTYTAAASSSVVGWYFSGSGVVSTITASIPRLTTTGTAIQFVSNISGDYIRYRFALDDADLSKKLLFQFAQIVAAAGEYKIEVYSGTVSSCTTLLALSTDASAVTALPALTGVFETSFDTTTATHYEIRFVATGASKTLKISDVLVSPDKRVGVGAVVGDWQSFTAAMTASGGGSVDIGSSGNATAASKYRRVGNSMEIILQYVWGTSSPAFGSSGSYRLTIPAGLTVDATQLPVASAAEDIRIGSGYFYDVSASDRFGLNVTWSNALVRFSVEESVTAAALGTASPVTIAAGDAVYCTLTIPIAEWAGSGTINVAQNDVEYAYNSAVADSSDTTSFAYGPAGVQFGSFSTAARTKRVQFQTAIQQTDRIEVEVYWNGAWLSVPATLGTVDATHGIVLDDTSGSNYVDVVFGSAGYSAAPNNSAGAWSTIAANANYKWRVKKSAGGQAVGFGLVNPGTSAGLVSANGLKGRTDGVALAAGYVGEIQTVTGGTSNYGVTSLVDTWTDASAMGTITLTPGVWLVSFSVCMQVVQSAAVTVGGNVGLYDGSAMVAGTVCYSEPASSTSGFTSTNTASKSVVVNLTASKTYSMRTRCTHATANGFTRILGSSISAAITNPDNESVLMAVRIA